MTAGQCSVNNRYVYLLSTAVNFPLANTSQENLLSQHSILSLVALYITFTTNVLKVSTSD